MPRPTCIILLSVFSVLVGCVRPQATVTVDIDPSGWSVRDTLRFEVTAGDTVSMRDIGILLRFDDTFAERQMPLTVRVTTPDSLWYEEPFTAVVGERTRVNNDFYEAAVPYRSQVVFAREGVYVFEIVNAGGELEGLWGAGITIN